MAKESWLLNLEDDASQEYRTSLSGQLPLLGVQATMKYKKFASIANIADSMMYHAN